MTSVQLSGFVLLGLSVNALLGLALPSALILCPRAAVMITFQGVCHIVTANATVRVMVNWIPDKENTMLSSMHATPFSAAPLSIMVLCVPVAQRVH